MTRLSPTSRLERAREEIARLAAVAAKEERLAKRRKYREEHPPKFRPTPLQQQLIDYLALRGPTLTWDLVSGMKQNLQPYLLRRLKGLVKRGVLERKQPEFFQSRIREHLGHCSSITRERRVTHDESAPSPGVDGWRRTVGALAKGALSHVD